MSQWVFYGVQWIIDWLKENGEKKLDYKIVNRGNRLGFCIRSVSSIYYFVNRGNRLGFCIRSTYDMFTCSKVVGQRDLLLLSLKS